MEIQIQKPIRFGMELLEIDQQIPSMRLHISIEIQQFNGNLLYGRSVWIDCAAWDAFVAGLGDESLRGATLTDMSGRFTFRLATEGRNVRALWQFVNDEVSGSIVRLSADSPIDDDTLAHITNGFMGLARW
uniref:hypothetical protein n=1 Tax=Bordetella sputigena TaxID=1416810 RepID=UPI0039EF4915